MAGIWRISPEGTNDNTTVELAARIPQDNIYDIRIPGTFLQNQNYFDYSYRNVFPEHHGYVWYYYTFNVSFLPRKDECAKIQFDDVGHVAEIYLNGKCLGKHYYREHQFSFGVTENLQLGENLLAIRCFHPLPEKEAIDEIELLNIPNAECSACGGVVGEVRLIVEPRVHITQIYTRPHAENGNVQVEITIENCSTTEKSICVDITCAEMKTGNPAACIQDICRIPVGISTFELQLHVPNHKLWDLNCPTLYLCQISLDGEMQKSVRFGFRTIELRNGFFYLNKKRIFLKCAHMGLTAEQVIGMKAMGFNACRSICNIFPTEVLDLCDEIGLLVIESPLTSWGMRDHEHTKKQIYSFMDNMILRDRTHPSVFAYYVFNELSAFGIPGRNGKWNDKEVFKAGVEYITRLRELDPDRIALFSSGRYDGVLKIGSVSKPGSNQWDFEWGAEGDPDFTGKLWNRNFTNTYTDLDGFGDIHPYARVPLDAETRRWFRTMGHNTKPVFISEAGTGSHTNPVRILRNLKANGAKPNSPNYILHEKMSQFLADFLDLNGFNHLYPFPESFCEETERLNARQREEDFDVIRANPMLCGYSLTSWGVSNEGVLEWGNVFKHGVSYALQTGWAPLRWSIFPECRTVYANQPFRLEAVLCNEDVLAPGTYPAAVRIHNENGIAWDFKFMADYPSDGYGNEPPLAANVLDETVSLPAGDYTIYAKLLEGGHAYGGRMPITVVEVDPQKANGKMIAEWGLSENTKILLEENGVKLVDFVNADIDTLSLLLIGNPDNMQTGWEKAMAFASAGGTVVFLNALPLAGKRIPGEDQMSNMPSQIYDDERLYVNPYLTEIAGLDARCTTYHNWLYHMDTIHIDHPIFWNTSKAGLLDMEQWDDICPEKLFLNMKQPDLVLAAGIGLRLFIEDQCAASQAMCVYNRGQGRVVINGLRIEENIGKHPFADQILLNIVNTF